MDDEGGGAPAGPPPSGEGVGGPPPSAGLPPPPALGAGRRAGVTKRVAFLFKPGTAAPAWDSVEVIARGVHAHPGLEFVAAKVLPRSDVAISKPLSAMASPKSGSCREKSSAAGRLSCASLSQSFVVAQDSPLSWVL